MTNEECVRLLYRYILGREADPAGLRDWTALIDQSGNVKAVIQGLITSPEFAARKVASNVQSASIDAGSTFGFRGYNIPEELALLTGGGGDTFELISDVHFRCLCRDADIQPDNAILEVGCGIGRDAIPLSEYLSANGSYVGIDIVRRSIEWCTANISSRYPNFRFVHFDVKEPLHNPSGIISSREVSFPIQSASIDRIILWSVFTHMVPEDTLHYLREFRRLLGPGGIVYATCFVLDEETLSAARRSAPTTWGLTFKHEHSPGCYLQDADCPSYAVGYTPQALNTLIAAGGLAKRRDFIRGSWCGLHAGDAGQDVMVLGLPFLAPHDLNASITSASSDGLRS